MARNTVQMRVMWQITSLMFAGLAGAAAAQSEQPTTVAVIGSVFTEKQRDGDFRWMIEQVSYQDALFVFNDNEQQYIAHRDHPEDASGIGCSPGGGNAIIRPYQCDPKQQAIGIPTGPNYTGLSLDVKKIIDESISRIAAYCLKIRCRRIFYNSDANGIIGTHIFSPGDDVKLYITQKLKSLSNNS